MTRFVPLLLLTAACSADQALLDVIEDDLQLDWTGRYTSDGHCTDGEVTLSVDAVDGEAFGFYEYDGFGADGHWARYEVEGVIQDGQLRIDQVALDDADDVQWCFGAMELGLFGADELAGRWSAEECGCAGQVVLEPQR